MHPVAPHRSQLGQRGQAAARAFGVLLLVSLSTGCVDRMLLVRSDPPGATVSVDGEVVGQTPLDGSPLVHEFTFYGRYEVIVRHPGRLSKRTVKTVLPPWYEHFPLDFFSEFCVPWTMRDEHEVNLVLAEAPDGDDDAWLDASRERASELYERGRRLRERVHPADAND